MRNKAFTLIELLAVIIILGILMLIAIPSVTSYINNSRKETYASTVQELIKAASTKVNSGELEVNDTDTTYYIPVSALDLENRKATSPYGDFDETYVIVTTDGDEYEYYYVGKDSADVGIENITRKDNLKNESIKTNIGEISTDIGIDRRHKIVVFNDNGVGIKVEKNAESRVDGKTGEEKKFLCQRAKTLHIDICSNNENAACYKLGYYQEGAMGTTTITYGNLGTTGLLETGDAFDCDVNEDGTYDPETERFYYVSDYYNGYSNSFESDKAVLMHFDPQVSYYASNDDIAAIGQTDGLFGYDSYHGPISIRKRLPDSSEWSNNKIIPPGIRRLTTEINTYIIKNNHPSNHKEYELEPFDYGDKVARILTYQEVVKACGEGDPTSEGYLLNKCLYLLERMPFHYYYSGMDWMYLENPFSTYIDYVNKIRSSTQAIVNGSVNSMVYYKSVIDVYLDDIDY